MKCRHYCDVIFSGNNLANIQKCHKKAFTFYQKREKQDERGGRPAQPSPLPDSTSPSRVTHLSRVVLKYVLAAWLAAKQVDGTCAPWKKTNRAASNRLKANALVSKTRCDVRARMKVYRATLPPCLLIYYQTNKAVNESSLSVIKLESR